MDRNGLRHPLNAASLRQNLTGPGQPWRDLEVVGETGSTNADLLARAAAGEDIDGAVLLAESQTAGRGRHGRSWSTPPRSQIALSVVRRRRAQRGVGLAAAVDRCRGGGRARRGHRAGGRPEVAQQCAPGRRKGPAFSPKWPHPNRWSWWVSGLNVTMTARGADVQTEGTHGESRGTGVGSPGVMS